MTNVDSAPFLMLFSRRARAGLFGLTLIVLHSHALAQPQLNPTGRDIDLQVPLQMGAIAVSVIPMRLHADDRISFEADALKSVMDGRLVDSAISLIDANASDGRIYADSVEEGLEFIYDPATLSVSVIAPQELLRQVTISLKPEVQEPQKTLRPVNVSAFINTDLSASYQNETEASQSSLSVNGRFDGAVRLYHPVLLFGADVISDESGSDIERRPVSVLVESREHRRLVQAGEIRTEAVENAQSLDILGVTVGRDFGLTPLIRTGPIGNRSFALDSTSTIDVFVNGRQVETLRLDAGRYSLEDIPLTNGRNNVVLEIDPDIGDVTTIDFSQFFDQGLLRKGELDYSASAGALREPGDELRYDASQLVVSANGRMGVSDNVTLAINGQATEDYALLGGAIAYANRLGTLNLALTTSNDSDSIGSAFSLGYRSYQGSLPAGGNLSWSLRHTTEDFIGLSETLSVNDESAENILGFETASTLSYSQRLGRFNMGASINYNQQSEDRDIQSTLNLSGALGGRRGWSWGVSLSSPDFDIGEDEDKDEVSVGLNLTWRPNSNIRYSLGSSSADESAFTGLSASNKVGLLGGYNASLKLSSEPDVSSEEDVYQVDLDGAYYSNRAIFSASHRSDLLAMSGERLDFSTLGLASSLAFADGRFGVGRPVDSSFALVDTHKSLEDRTLRIDPRDDSQSALNGLLGAALITELSLHRAQTIRYSVDDLPVGYNLGEGLFQVKPWFGSGYKLTVGSAATATVVANLLDDNSGEPIALLAGEAVSEQNPDVAPVQFFTNRTGRFAITGVIPGEDYTLQFLSGRKVTISVPDGEGTLIKMGDVFLP